MDQYPFSLFQACINYCVIVKINIYNFRKHILLQKKKKKKKKKNKINNNIKKKINIINIKKF